MNYARRNILAQDLVSSRRRHHNFHLTLSVAIALAATSVVVMRVRNAESDEKAAQTTPAQPPRYLKQRNHRLADIQLLNIPLGDACAACK